MPSPLSISDAMNSAIRFLERRQLPHGQFRAYASPSTDLSNPRYADSCVFVTAVIAHGLGCVESPVAAEMRRRAREFLLSEMQAGAVWSYWTIASGMDIDPDLDDTAMCSFVLRAHHPDVASLNRERVLANRSEEGLFQTWLRPRGRTNDVDSVVNANVLLYLGEGEETHDVCGALVRMVLQGREADTSWYYPDTMSLYHAIARAWAHGGVRGLGVCRERIEEAIRARRLADGSFGDALATSMGLSTLLTFGVTTPELVEPALRWLLRAQDAEGGWARCAFYTGPEAPHRRNVWFGSEDLTTVIALDALAASLIATGSAA
ncbi:terpene cyclase/mutase family protein [Myxococcaceae bacterium GXIMD 01537]